MSEKKPMETILADVKKEHCNSISLKKNDNNNDLVISYGRMVGNAREIGRFIAQHHKDISTTELHKLQLMITRSNNLDDLITYMNYAINNADKKKVIREFFEYSLTYNYVNMKLPHDYYPMVDFLARYKYCPQSALHFMVPLIFIGDKSHAYSIFQLYRSCKNDNIRRIIAENIIKNDMMPYLCASDSRHRYILKSMLSLLPSSAELGILI